MFITPAAARLGKFSENIHEIPPVDIVITMGCNVKCPFLPCKHREDWGLDDSTGKSDTDFVSTIKTIESNIQELKIRIMTRDIIV